MEFLDVLDCQGRNTGNRISRDEAHASGVWHGAFHCLIIHEQSGRGYALFQKRSASKRIAPAKFDVSVGGHYATGENSAIAGPREIREELGLDVDFRELLSLGRRVFVHCFTPGVTEYEFQDVFLLQKNIQPQECVLQEEEVDGLLEMDIEKGIELFTGIKREVACNFVENDSSVKRIMATSEEFVPCLDNYYLKLLLLARQYFHGDRSLFI